MTAQSDSTWTQRPSLTLSGFIDVFYAYDFNQPDGTARLPFLFNHNRHNEFNLNLGLIKLSVEQTKYRANLALQTGVYANDNYVAEPGLLKNIFEANIGIALDKTNKLWLDAGIFPSHLGFESAISMDNLTLTRSLPAENSPYFLTGVKLSYAPNDHWQLAALITNGWQRIQRLEDNSLPSFGTQVIYKPSEKTLLNWSTLIGTDDPNELRRMRYFNNFFGQFALTDHMRLIAGMDYGAQQRTNGSSEYDTWYSPAIIAQADITHHWKAAVRLEYFHDETGIIVPIGTANGFQTTGLSFNMDYSPAQQIVCRIESRWLHSKDNIFESNNTLRKNNFSLAASLAIKFEEVLSK